MSEELNPSVSLRLTAPFRQGSLSYLQSNATFTLKEVGQLEGLVFSEAESVEAL